MVSRRGNARGEQPEVCEGGNNGLRPAYRYILCGPDPGMVEAVGPAHNDLDRVSGVGPQDLGGEGPDANGLEITCKPAGLAKVERFVASCPRQEPKLGG